MDEQAGIAELKARLSHYLRRVRGGRSITVVARDRPVARLVPYEQRPGLAIREPLPGAPALKAVPLPKPLRVSKDIVDLLIEERGTR
ncbi:MAG: type II toxin-antitoxin system prevent-host-death family antitoxin [Gemmatimonadota bacterium]